MSDSFERTLKVAKDALELLFSDRSVGPGTTMDALSEICEDLEVKVAALAHDIDRAEEPDDDDGEEDPEEDDEDEEWVPEDEEDDSLWFDEGEGDD